MRKKISKLIVALALLTGSLAGGLTARTAAAAGFCPDYCVDAACTCVIHCWRLGGSCVCEDFCLIDN